jgi:hypothetical protein
MQGSLDDKLDNQVKLQRFRGQFSRAQAECTRAQAEVTMAQAESNMVHASAQAINQVMLYPQTEAQILHNAQSRVARFLNAPSLFATPSTPAPTQTGPSADDWAWTASHSDRTTGRRQT